MDLNRYKGLPRWAKEADPHRHAYSSYMDRAIERRQLDGAIEAVDATVDYLYGEFTPETCRYVSGTRPLLEMIVDTVCRGCKTDQERAVRLVRWRRANYQHVNKCGLGSEEEILLGGYSMCHDASRSLIALCQVAGMGARMIIGLNDKERSGHTLTEVFVSGKWSVFDPSPCIPFAFYRLPDGTLASAWDIRKDPEIPLRCKPEFASPRVGIVGSYFRNYRLANYSLEESTRNMAVRFLRLVAAQKIVENYDYTGHLNHPPLSAFADLDKMLRKWVRGTLAPRPDSP
jgi:hypothetical protein